MKTPRRAKLIIGAMLIALACLALLPGMLAPNVGAACIWIASYIAAVVFLQHGMPQTKWYAPILMAACATSNFWEFRDDFMGDRVYSATKGSNVGHGYTLADTSSAGTPTYADVDGSESGASAFDFDNTNEVQNLCLYQGDQLQFDIDKIVEFGCLVKTNVTTFNAATSFAIGLTGDRNDAIDSIAQAAIFRVIGASQAIYVETDDGTHDNDDVATGATLSTTYKWLTISFACGKSDVRFFVNGQPVATGTTFDMSSYSGSLQLFAQIQKTAATATDGFTIEEWYVRGRKTLTAA